jgi:hypothetical protein
LRHAIFQGGRFGPANALEPGRPVPVVRGGSRNNNPQNLLAATPQVKLHREFGRKSPRRHSIKRFCRSFRARSLPPMLQLFFFPVPPILLLGFQAAGHDA